MEGFLCASIRSKLYLTNRIDLLKSFSCFHLDQKIVFYNSEYWNAESICTKDFRACGRPNQCTDWQIFVYVFKYIYIWASHQILHARTRFKTAPLTLVTNHYHGPGAGWCKCLCPLLDCPYGLNTWLFDPYCPAHSSPGVKIRIFSIIWNIPNTWLKGKHCRIQTITLNDTKDKIKQIKIK